MSAQLILRTTAGGTANTVKAAPLTNAEMDQNFINLDNEIDGKLSNVNPSYTGTLTGGTGVVNLGSGQFVKDASGNLGLGVTPEAWNYTVRAFHFNKSAIANNGNTTVLTSNAYFDPSYTPVYTADAVPAAALRFNPTGSGGMSIDLAPSGTAGNPISFTQAMTLDASSNLAVEGQIYANGRGVTKGFVTPDWRMYNTASGNALTWNNGTDRMTLDASGNLTFPNGTFSRPGGAGQYIIGTLSGGLYNQVGGNYYAVITDENIASRIPAQTVQRNSSGYVIPENWIQLNGAYGLYSPINGAHFAVNDIGSYTPWRVSGTRSGWSGMHFTDPNTALMLSPDGTNVGFHAESAGWKFRWSAGTLLCSKGVTGGGTEATVWDSANLPVAQGASGGTVVQRDANGYIYNGYINTNTSESENPSIGSFFVSSGDGFIRKATAQHAANTLAPLVAPMIATSGAETAREIYSGDHTWGNLAAGYNFKADILINGGSIRNVFCEDEFVVDIEIVDYWWVNLPYQGQPDAKWVTYKSILLPNTDPNTYTTRIGVNITNSHNSGPMMYYPNTIRLKIRKIGKYNQQMTLTNIYWGA